MPTVTVNIQPEIIEWALNQTSEDKLGEKLLTNIEKWLDGTKKPTFHQIEEFSKKSNIPLGYFFLQTPPDEQIELLEYRTFDSVQLTNPSRNLISTIHEMEDVQEWMKNYRQEFGFERNLIVGCVKDDKSADIIADQIREDLGIAKNWYKNCKKSHDAFSYIRSRLEECGVLVMLSGIVGQNTHRALDPEEFRAFAIADEWAPLIFINSSDSEAAKLFSLMHEMAHIWIGVDDLYNDSIGQAEKVKPLEKMCNAVAAELLVPKKIFLEKWDDFDENIFKTIKDLAKEFCCGEVVIARRALDFEKINKSDYNKTVRTAIDNYSQMKKEKRSSNGDFYKTQTYRLDKCLVRALCESIAMGMTSYTDAYRLTNTSPKTFPEIARNLGGVGW